MSLSFNAVKTFYISLNVGDLLKGSIRERLDEGTYLVFLYKWKIQKATECRLQTATQLALCRIIGKNRRIEGFYFLMVTFDYCICKSFFVNTVRCV